ncbi:MAG: FMN-binding protein [Bacillota bacterium]|nr:FMN-binding protein [Bacillota bacterium]
MKKVLKIICIILIVIIAVLTVFFIVFNHGMSDVKNAVVSNVDLSKINDGIYPGTFKGGRWSNTVEVTVRNHQIVEIRVDTNQTIPAQDVANKVFDSIMKKQTPKVDVVSGATVSSKGYMKSVEIALKNALAMSK